MLVSCRDLDGSADAVWEYIRAHAFHLGDQRPTRRRASYALGISESTLHRVLNSLCGGGFHDAVERIRVEQALTLLVDDPCFKIGALALAVGWKGRANLYSAIRRVTGRSLADLRKDREGLQRSLAILLSQNASAPQLLPPSALPQLGGARVMRCGR